MLIYFIVLVYFILFDKIKKYLSYVFFIVFFSKSFPRISKMDIYINVQKRNTANLCYPFFLKKNDVATSTSRKNNAKYRCWCEFFALFFRINEKNYLGIFFISYYRILWI